MRENAADREIVATRTIEAPSDLVHRALIEPASLARSWGPRGFTTEIEEHTEWNGGRWRYVMRGADGKGYLNESVYTELLKGQRVHLRHVSLPHFELEIDLAEEYSPAGSTRVVWRMRFDSPAICAAMRPVVETANVQVLDRLAVEVELLRHGGPFVTERVLDAPRDRVWRAWTDEAALREWYVPRGFSVGSARLDLRPGGGFHYGWRSAEGNETWGRLAYRELRAPERLVMIRSFSNSAGEVTRHPLAATWPRETHVLVTLSAGEGPDEEAGRARLRIEESPFDATEFEMKTFLAAGDKVGAAWGDTLSRLDAYL